MMTKGLTRGLTVVVAALIALTISTAVWAQNNFYREVEKDGRIYVFTQMARFEDFDKSGEMGVGISRLGYGPAGETVIFDSNEAINLYNFKHDKPGEVFAQPKPSAPKPPDNFSIKVGSTIFTDFTYTDSPKVKDADGNLVKKNEFELRRAYINVTGNISDIVAFRITPDVGSRASTSTTSSGLGTGATVAASNNYDGSLVVRLKYAFGQFNFDRWGGKGSWVRFGQQQTPYVDFIEGIYRYRFQGTTFVDREGYLSSSDVGISGRYGLPNDYGDIHAGFYNGDTYSKPEANDQKAFMIRGTLRPAPKVEAIKGLRFTAFYDLDHPVKDADRKRFVGTVTFEHKYVNAGFEYLDAKDSSSATKATVEGNGYSIFATPKTTKGLEALLRYDSFKPNKDVDARRNRSLFGIAYWLPVGKAGLATALLADYERVKYDAPLNKPEEKRFELKALFNF